MKEKVILVDCDGVLFDWEYAFDQWMKKHGYKVIEPGEYKVKKKYGITKCEADKLTRMFNESAWIRKLPQLRDAKKYVKKLHEDHGYIFHAITSLSNDTYAQHLRTKNLIEMFGPTVFEKYVYLDTGADKDEALAEYEGTGCYWVEDKPQNVDLGIKLGLNGILMKHAHNQHYEGTAKTVGNWEEIYQEVV
jgi:FMN phosphatase YigB (HAD superfamily)|tara:strand:+ start:62 stop:634 length:573 start_codon:yes stop_codon:yes gene_type:complete